MADGEQALAWARAERANPLGCLDYVTAGDQHSRVIALTAGISGLLLRDGLWTVAVVRHTAAAQAAQRLGDRLSKAKALTDLGRAWQQTGDYRAAVQALEEAMGIFRDVGHRLGQANVLTYLGAVRRLTGDYPAAARALD